jgi:hypothetical protein
MSHATPRSAIPTDERGAPQRAKRGSARSRWLSLIVAVIAPIVVLSGVTVASHDGSNSTRSVAPAARMAPDAAADASRAVGTSRIDGEFDGFSTSKSGNLALAGDPSVFVPIAAYRSYDSRDQDGKWFAGDAFPITALVDLRTRDYPIPFEATAVAFNIAAVGTEGSGYIQVYGPGTDPFSTSTVNWRQSGLAIANSGSSMLGEVNQTPGFMGIAVGGQLGARTHIIIDITGYYLPVS